MKQSWLMCETLTGKPLKRVWPTQMPWERRIGDGTENTATFICEPGTDWSQMMIEWKHMIVVDVDGYPPYCGIVTDTDYDRDTRTLTVSHADVWTLLSKRTTLGEDGYSTVNFSEDIVGYTLASILKIIFRLAFEGPTGSNYRLNFIWDYLIPDKFPSNGSGAPHDGAAERHFRDWNVTKMFDAIKELMTAAGGPEVEFPGRWDANGNYQWYMRIGTPAAPRLTGPTITWNLGAKKPPLSKVRYRRKGKDMATVVTGLGAGSEVDRVFAKASIDSDYPALERDIEYSQETSKQNLQSHVDQDLADYRNPIVEMTATFQIDDPRVGITDIVLGQTASVWEPDDPRIPNGWTNYRVVSVAGNVDNEISVALQPLGI